MGYQRISVKRGNRVMIDAARALLCIEVNKLGNVLTVAVTTRTQPMLLITVVRDENK